MCCVLRIFNNERGNIAEDGFLFLSGTKQVSGATGKRAGDLVYDVDALDSDGDAVLYTLTTDPQSDLFEIGHSECLTQGSAGYGHAVFYACFSPPYWLQLPAF